MPAPEFLDTNVVVYAYDPTDRRKQRIARELLRRAVAGELVISTQILGEFAATLLHKMSPPTDPVHVQKALDALAPIPLIGPDRGIVRRAVEAHAKYGMHFYDAMIIAAAERGGCSKLWSEDLNAGQSYFGVTVENPFA